MLDLNKSDDELRQDFELAVDEERRSSKHVKIVIVIVSLLLLVGIAGAVIIYQRDAAIEAASRKRMDENGAEARAFLRDEITILTWKNGKKTYKVDYTFDVGTRTFSGTCELARRPESPNATAIYDPENPAMNKLRGIAVPPMDNSVSSSSAFENAFRYTLIALILGGIETWRRRRKAKGESPAS